MESFCCVGSPGVFLTPGTYHVLLKILIHDYMADENLCELFLGLKNKCLGPNVRLCFFLESGTGLQKFLILIIVLTTS